MLKDKAFQTYNRLSANFLRIDLFKASYNKIGCNQIQNRTGVQSLPNIWLVFLIHCMIVKRELPKKENELIFSAEITLPQMLRRCVCAKLILR